MTAFESKQFEDAADSMFELIEFTLDRRINGEVVHGIYGVNVVKVREVVRLPKINPLNSKVKGMAGVFELRGVPIPVINLASVLDEEHAEIKSGQKVIVTEFGVKRAGFIVDNTHRIRRISWNQVMPPSSDVGSYITAMTLIENNEFLFILDLEKILFDLDGAATMTGKNPVPQFMAPANWQMMPTPDAMVAGRPVASQNSNLTVEGGVKGAPHILLVDDSSFILKNTKIGLNRVGLNVITASNGKIAYEILEKFLAGQLHGSRIDAVVTDVEMPQMDGFTLTKKIREHAALAEMPIIIHSSLSGKATQDTGMALGANGYIVKNDIKNLVEALTEIIGWTPQKVSA